MKLSVIVPCRNAADFITTQLDAFAKQRWSEPWEVIIADNGSTDESLAVVERYKKRLPNLSIVDASARRGASYARNVGAQVAAGNSLAFCDADDEVAPGWVAAMGEALSKHDFVAGRFDTEKLNPSWVQKAFGNHPQRDGLPRIWYPPYLLYAGGSGLGVKRSLHEAVSGFDESLLALEDADYCFRIQLVGVGFYFVPNAVIHVRYRDEFGGIFSQTRLWGEYNVLMYKRHRQAGMKLSRPWKRYMNKWKYLLLHLPQIRSREGRTAWVRSLGWQIGLLQGSIKYRASVVPF